MRRSYVQLLVSKPSNCDMMSKNNCGLVDTIIFSYLYTLHLLRAYCIEPHVLFIAVLHGLIDWLVMISFILSRLNLPGEGEPVFWTNLSPFLTANLRSHDVHSKQ